MTFLLKAETFLSKGSAYILRHDAYLFCALLAVLIPAMAWLQRSPRWLERRAALGWVLRGLAVILLAGFCGVAIQYLVTPVYFEHVEPQIPEAAWYRLTGHPLYPNLDSAQIYNLPYGPMTYWLQGWFDQWFGPSLMAGKIPGVLANIAMLGVLFWVFKRQSSAKIALLAVGLSAAFFMKADGNAITGRSDSLLCLFVALGLAAATSRLRATPIILGVLLGIAANFKIHAALYFIPVAAVALHNGYTVKQGLAAVGVSLVVFLAPFFCLANISLMDYLLFIKAIVGHGFSLLKLQQLLWCFAVVMMAGAGAWLLWRAENRAQAAAAVRANALVVGGFLLSFVLLLAPASKYGAGSHHLMPWLVATPYLALEFYRSGFGAAWLNPQRARCSQVFLLAWAFACFAEALLALNKVEAALEEHASDGAKVVADIQNVLQTHDQDYTILMGVGGQDDAWLTSYRCLLIFDHMPIGIDWVALMDYKRAHQPASELAKFVAEMQAERSAPKGVLWLVPKYAAPFSVLTYYPPYDVLFDPRFRDDFARQFKHTGSSEFYDFYTSASPPGPAAAK